MVYPDNFEYKIGFDEIREMLSSKCLCNLGKEKVENLSFSSDYAFLNKELHRTEEFRKIIEEEEEFPSDYFYDLREALKKIRIEGTYLTSEELFAVRRSLQTINEIILFFTNRKEENKYPYLQELLEGITSFPDITKSIDNILDKFGNVKDNASADLNRIRREINSTTSGISRILQNILHNAQSEGLIDKDTAPALRDGRLVIPIAPAFKRKLKGIVHDESASGKTIFVEPNEVVEANNKIRELENQEKREIIKILTDFSNRIRPLLPEITHAYEFMASIDFIRAKAKFAIETDAILPPFEEKQQLDWTEAKHPLLYLSHKAQGKTVVPLDIRLEKEKGRILIISGPNAGGKSVCIKTVGLIQYMLQCGLLVPLSERSKTGLFENLFIDIGDEQSIENDLSTYSSHLTNMKFFVKHCDPETIILIDEFGSGTEPQIGGAIAEALLDRYNRKGCFGVINTHYQNLKRFAEDHEGIVNGAMLYDRQLMQPLFKLSIGNPGSSFAIEIARKIGLPEEIISAASEIVGQDYIDMDKYLQDIVRDKRYWQTKRQNIRQKEKSLEEITDRYKSDLQNLEKQKKEILATAKEEAEKILRDSNARIENTIRKIKEAQADKEKTREARRLLEEFRTEILSPGKEEEDIIQRKIQKIKNREREKKQEKISNANVQIKKEDPEIRVSDFVKIKDQNSYGEIIEIKDKNAVVAFGNIKSVIALNRLEKVSKNRIKKTQAQNSSISRQTSDAISEKKLHFKTEIDIRGMRVDEALQAVTYYIDDAIQCGAQRVRILHGTGTGALRQITRDYLSTFKGIASYHDEQVQLGGSGITVVEFG